MNYRCPVCMFEGLPYPPADYHICPCCGTEFGNDDAEFSHEQLRDMWISSGAHWFFGVPPPEWDAWAQLLTGLGVGIAVTGGPVSYVKDAISFEDVRYHVA